MGGREVDPGACSLVVGLAPCVRRLFPVLTGAFSPRSGSDPFRFLAAGAGSRPVFLDPASTLQHNAIAESRKSFSPPSETVANSGTPHCMRQKNRPESKMAAGTTRRQV